MPYTNLAREEDEEQDGEQRTNLKHPEIRKVHKFCLKAVRRTRAEKARYEWDTAVTNHIADVCAASENPHADGLLAESLRVLLALDSWSGSVRR